MNDVELAILIRAREATARAMKHAAAIEAGTRAAWGLQEAARGLESLIEAGAETDEGARD